MAVIAPTTLTGGGVRSVTRTVLSASDTLPFAAGFGAVLVLLNTTGGALSPVIDGADGTTVNFPGAPAISVSGGYAVGSIPATTGAVAIPLDTIGAYLQGVVTITGGTGLTALLLQY